MLFLIGRSYGEKRVYVGRVLAGFVFIFRLGGLVKIESVYLEIGLD